MAKKEVDPEKEELKRLFLLEAKNKIKEIGQNIEKLKKKPDDKEIINSISKAAHSLEGNSLVLGKYEAGYFANKLSSIAETGNINLLLSLFDSLKKALEFRKEVTPKERAEQIRRTREILDKLKQAEEEKEKAEEEKEKLLNDYKERVKELNCLYGLSKLVEKPGITLNAIFRGTVYLLRLSFQYSNITHIRIIFKDKEYKTKNFRTSKWKLSSNIKFYGKKAGLIEIYYLENKPFSREEQNLITAIAERLGRISERMTSLEKLKNA